MCWSNFWSKLDMLSILVLFQIILKNKNVVSKFRFYRYHKIFIPDLYKQAPEVLILLGSRALKLYSKADAPLTICIKVLHFVE